jgi:hypothetical protein
MLFTFYNNWSLTVTTVALPPGVQTRVLIAGSQASDGTYPGVVGEQVASINGNSWQVSLQSSNDNGANWGEGETLRNPSVTQQNGIIVTLTAIFPAFRGTVPEFVVQFVYLNQQVNPQGPAQAPPVFTLPAGSFWPKLPGREPQACCCCCGKPMCGCGFKPGVMGRGIATRSRWR